MAAQTDNNFKLTNAEFSKILSSQSEIWETLTSKGTKDIFNENGFTELDKPIDSSNRTYINEFTNLLMRILLNKISVSTAKSLLDDVVEKYGTPNGAMIQRINIDPIDPINPQSVNLDNMTTYSPFLHRKPNARERFYKQNFNFTNVISITDDDAKQVFLDNYGISAFVAGVLQQLSESYKKQKSLNRFEVLNKIVNDVNLKDTQQVEYTVADTSNMTDVELRKFINVFKDVVDSMINVISTDKFNTYGFDKSIDKSDLVLLMRPTIYNQIATQTMYGAFHTDFLDFGIPIVKVNNFGGLVPTGAGGGDITLTYDEWGLPTNKTDVKSYRDPNQDVACVLIEKGAIFETTQNEFTIKPAPYNPRTRETTYWSQATNNGIYYDTAYNVVKFTIK